MAVERRLSEEEKFREERQRSIGKALEQTETARASAQESARRFREVEAGRPFGPLPSQAPERVKQRKFIPERDLARETRREVPNQPLPKQRFFQSKPSTPTRKSGPRRQRSRRGTFGLSFRPRRAGGRPPNLPDSPANIDPSEKKLLLERLDLALAKENRKYATQIRHGTPDPRQQETRQKIQQLENQKRAVQNMKPTGHFRYSIIGGLQRIGNLPGHVREAEKG